MLNTDGLDALVPALEKRLSAVVRKTAFDAQAIAQRQVARDTGAAANSIYTAAKGFDGYPGAKAAVLAKNPGAEVFDPVDINAIDSALTAIVAVMVYYGIYLEFGTARMAAQPFFMSAIAAVEADYIKRCGQALNAAATGSIVTKSIL